MAEHKELSYNIIKERLAGKKVAIVCAKFNNHITGEMLKQAKQACEENNVEYSIYEVAGSFELIYASAMLAKSGEFAGIVPLGCLIKGETHHYEYIANAVSLGIKDLVVKHNMPIGFGVLTCLNEAHAMERVGLGKEATLAVLESISVFD